MDCPMYPSSLFCTRYLMLAPSGSSHFPTHPYPPLPQGPGPLNLASTTWETFHQRPASVISCPPTPHTPPSQPPSRTMLCPARSRRTYATRVHGDEPRFNVAVDVRGMAPRALPPQRDRRWCDGVSFSASWDIFVMTTLGLGGRMNTRISVPGSGGYAPTAQGTTPPPAAMGKRILRRPNGACRTSTRRRRV